MILNLLLEVFIQLFSSKFVLLFVFILTLMFMLQLVSLCSFLCIPYVLKFCIYAVLNASKVPFLLFLICSQCHVRPCASLSISLSFGSFDRVPPLSILRMVQSILQEELPRCLFLWRDYCCRVWSSEVFLFFEVLSLPPLPPSFIWWCLLSTIPNTCNFHFLQLFWCFPHLVVLFIVSFFPFSNIYMAHFQS